MDSRYLGVLTPDERRELLLDAHHRQGGVCFICQQPIDLEDAGELPPALDLIQPLEAGGADVAENVAALHDRCAAPRSIRDLRLARALAGIDRVRTEFQVAARPGDATTTPDPEAEPPLAVVPDPEPDPVRQPTPAAEPTLEPKAVLGPEPESGPRLEPLFAPQQPFAPPPPPLPEGDQRSYGGALGLTVLGAAVPGSAYLAAGRRRLGFGTLAIAVLLVVLLVALVLRGDVTSLAAEIVSRPVLLDVLGFAVLVAAALWIFVIATGHRMVLPRRASRSQQIIGGVLTLLLAAAVAIPAIVVSRYAFATHDLIDKVFGADGQDGGSSGIDRSDPWKDIPRLNLLVLGGDSTSDGGLTTNTMIVISIDTTTGKTVLFGLPRNLHNAPIPADNPLHAIYPTGYRCGTQARSCLLSGLYSEAEVANAGLFDGEADPGLTTLRGSVGEITGLEVNYYLLVDLIGFEQVVDALGGIDLNVGPEPVPIPDLDADGNPLPPDASTRYIPSGRQHLTGEEALAFTRVRRTDASSDDKWLLRQRSVISAVVDRADPVNLLLSYLEVASSASDAIHTDVPVELLPAFVDLSKLARAQEIGSHSIANDTAVNDPDFAAIRQLVQSTLSS
jgi:LCP family protein required for cell wall assembly